MQRESARYTITIASDFRVVGYDPEAADFDRPRGEIVREVFYLVATDAEGYRKAFGSYDSIEEVEAVIGFAPSVDDEVSWYGTLPEYGSKAYIDTNAEFEQMDRERECDRFASMGIDTRFMFF